MYRKTLFILVTLTFLLLAGCGKESLPVEIITPTHTATQPRPTGTPSPSATPTKRTQFVIEYTSVPTEQAWLETALFPVPFQPVGVSSSSVPTPIATPDMQGYRYQLKEWSDDDALALIQVVDNYVYESDAHGPVSSRPVYALHTPLKFSITEAIYRFPTSRYSEEFQWKLAVTNGILGVEDTDDWIINTLEDGLNSGLYKPEDLERVLFLKGFILDVFGVYDLFGIGEDGQILIISPQFSFRDDGLLVALREIKEGEYDLILMDSYWNFLYGRWSIHLDEISDRTGNSVPEILAITPNCNLLIFEWQGEKFVDLSRGEIRSVAQWCRFDFKPEDYPGVEIISHLSLSKNYYTWNGEYFELVRTEISRGDTLYDLYEHFWQSDYSRFIQKTKKIIEEWPIQESDIEEYGPAFPDLLRFNLGLAYAHNSEPMKAMEILQDLAQSPSVPEYTLLSTVAETFLSIYKGNRSEIFKACSTVREILQKNTIPPLDKNGRNDYQSLIESIGFKFYSGRKINCHSKDALTWLIASFQPEQMRSIPQLLEQNDIVVHRQTQFDFDQDGDLDWILYIELPQWEVSESLIIINNGDKLETYFPDVDLYDVPDQLSVEFITLSGISNPTIIIRSGNGFSIQEILSEGSELKIETILDEHYVDFYDEYSFNSSNQFDLFTFWESRYNDEECPEFWFFNQTYQWDSLDQEFIEIDLRMDIIFTQGLPEIVIPILKNNLQAIQKYYLRVKAVKEKCDYVYENFYPGRAHLLYLLGLAYELNGDEALAVKTYYQLWREHPDSAYAIMAKAKLELIKP